MAGENITYGEKLLAAKKKALPDVEKLVAKYGMTAVRGAITMLIKVTNKQGRLKRLKQEVRTMEKELKSK